MIYNVFGGTLNLAQLNSQYYCWYPYHSSQRRRSIMVKWNVYRKMYALLTYLLTYLLSHLLMHSIQQCWSRWQQRHHGFCHPGGQYKRYKDCLKTTMTQCGIITLNRKHSQWTAVEEFEVRCIQRLEAKQDLRKSGPPSTSNFECQICHRMCRSQIGLLAHNRFHSR